MTQTADPTVAADGLEAAARRLDEAEQVIAELDPPVQAMVRQALAASADLNRRALVTIVQTLRADPRGKELLFDLVDDPEIKMVLMMHGIIRPDPRTQAEQVLRDVRPNLQSHGGDVVLDSIEDGVVYVRLQGACNGCSMAAVTMREGVEKALIAGVPGVRAVEVLPNASGPTLIPLGEIGFGVPGLADKGWVRVCALGEIDEGAFAGAEVVFDERDSAQVIVVNLGGNYSAYLNQCAHQGLPLDNGVLDVVEGTLTCPWHGFCYDLRDGECLTMPGAKLEQLPVQIAEQAVWVRRA